MKTARAEIKKASTNYRIAFSKKPVAQVAMLVLLGAVCVMPAAAQTDASAADAANAKTLEAVTITSQREARVSTGATGLNLDIKETPQSISTVTAEQMRDFGAASTNDALRLSTGIQVEEWETNRTNYTARGFDIVNTQIDGVGMPNSWGIVTGAVDSFGYEKVEVIRGANGLLTGVGNSSGTINYVRKRPTNDQQGSVGVSYGSWGTRRAETDYSTPLTEDGRWAGRLVTATESGGSYLRDLENDRTFLYGVIDGQIGDNGTLTFGFSDQQAKTEGNMWGGLTFNTTDGGQVEWDRGVSTTQDWTYWDTSTQNAFVEYTHQLASNWRLKASYNYRRFYDDTQMFYPYTYTGLDPITDEGLLGWSYKAKSTTTSHLGDINASGHFELLGREHEVMFGTSLARSTKTLNYYAVDASEQGWGTFPVLPAFPYAGDAVPEPDWGARSPTDTLNQRLTRVYGATRLRMTDKLKVIGGFNLTEYHRDGDDGAGTSFTQTEREISPYAGLTYDFTDRLLGYASYSDIYQPQEQKDSNGEYLDPSKGVNYEVGVKMDWFDKRLLTSLAWFNAEQKGLATFGGTDPVSYAYWYYGMDVKSQGLEFEASGKLANYLNLVFGYTTMEMTDEGSDTSVTWAPRHTANLALSGRLPSYPALTLGASGRWQSKTSNQADYSELTVRQDSYAVLNAFAAWQVLPNATLRFNVKNLTDEKYIGSMYQVGYYGAPRSYQASLNYQF